METYCAVLMASADLLESLGDGDCKRRARNLRYIARDKWPEDYANEMQWRTNPDRPKCIHCDAFADECEHTNRDPDDEPHGMGQSDRIDYPDPERR